MEKGRYEVVWEEEALLRLGKLFNINHLQVYRRSKLLLSLPSYLEQGYIADYPGFEFNDYFWTLIQDVIVVYNVAHKQRSVHVEACYYANTELSHEIFWGINPDEE